MAIQHRVLFGIPDVRSLTFECRRCGVRLSVVPEKARADKIASCPSCQEAWVNTDTNQGHYFQNGLAVLVGAIPHAIRALADEACGVNVSVEFDWPPPAPQGPAA